MHLHRQIKRNASWLPIFSKSVEEEEERLVYHLDLEFASQLSHFLSWWI